MLLDRLCRYIQKSLLLPHLRALMSEHHSPTATPLGFQGNRRRNLFLLGFIILSAVVATWQWTRYTTKQSTAPLASLPTTKSPTVTPRIYGTTGGLKDWESYLPITWEGESHALDRQHVRVIFSQYDDSYAVEAKGDLVPQGVEVRSLRLKMALVDDVGKVVFTKYSDLIESYNPPVRAHEVIPVGVLVYEKQKAPRLSHAVLRIDTIEAVSAHASIYPQTPALPLKWTFEKPTGIEVEMRVRNAHMTALSKPSAKLVLSFKNIGQLPIRKLQIKMAFFDAQQQEVGSGLRWLLLDSSAPLRPQTMRSLTTYTDLQAGTTAFDHYTVSIVEAN